jgi:transposase-like protein
MGCNSVSEESKRLARITHTIAMDFGVRRCTHCNMDRSNKGGMQIKFSNGLRYRWICQGCKENRERGQQERKKVDGQGG